MLWKTCLTQCCDDAYHVMELAHNTFLLFNVKYTGLVVKGIKSSTDIKKALLTSLLNKELYEIVRPASRKDTLHFFDIFAGIV